MATRSTAIYPDNVSIFEDLDRVIREYVLVDYPPTSLLANDKAVVVTQGSCFARNLAKSLAGMGANVAHLNVNEFINTTIANAMFFEYVFKDGPKNPQISAAFAPLINEQQAMEFRELVTGCSAFVLTIGVAPCWFVRGTDNIVLSPDLRRIADFEMRTTPSSWNAANIVRIIQSIRLVNKEAPIFLTLSPAPLNRSFEFSSTIVADCLSKSVLRVAIEEVLATRLPKVHYWPSFEIVRWVGSHLGPVFGAEDGHPRHVSTFVVDAIVKAFIEINGGRTGGTPRGVDELENTGPFMLARNF